MARIYKGSSYTLQLLIAKSTSSPIENVKFDFFTIDPKVTVLVEDGITIDGNLAKVKIGDTQFDALADGLISYVVYGTRDGMSFMEERQSNYYLKTPEGEKPVIPDVDMNNYYTKEEVDGLIDDIEVEVDLTGIATEEWVEGKNYATESYVDDAIANLPSGSGDTSDLQAQILAIESRTSALERYGKQFIMTGVMTSEGLSNLQMDKGQTIADLQSAVRNQTRPDIYIRLNDALEFKPSTIMRDMFTDTINIVLLTGPTLYGIEITNDGQINSAKIDLF